MTRPRAALATLTLALAACLSACGGGGETDEHGGVSDRDAYVVKGNAICDALSTKLARFATAVPTDSASQLDLIVDKVLPATQQALDALKALPPPPGDADILAGLYAEMQSGFDQARADPTGGGSAGSDITTKLDQYGLTSCGSALGG